MPPRVSAAARQAALRDQRLAKIRLNESSPRFDPSEIPRAKVTLKPHQTAMVKRCLDIETNEYQNRDRDERRQKEVQKRREIENRRINEEYRRQEEEEKRYHMTVEFQERRNNREKEKKELEDERAAEDADAPKLYPYGVMSAPVGCGKTFSILSLCLLDKYQGRKKALWEFLLPSKKQTGATLIVVPSHLFQQWDDAINEFVGDALNVHRFNNYSDTVRLFDQKNNMIHKADVFLVSALYYQALATALISMKIVFRRLIFDEADSLSRLINYTTPATFTWFVSASIQSLSGKNGLKIGSEGQFYVPIDVLLSNTVDCDPEFIRVSFNLPKTVEGVQICDEECDEDDERTKKRKRISKVIPKILQRERVRRAFFGCDPRSLEVEELGEFNNTTCGDELTLAVGLVRGWKSKLEHMHAIETKTEEEESEIATLASNLEQLLQALTELDVDVDDGSEETEESDDRVFFKLDRLLRLCKAAGKKKTIVFTQFPRLLYDMMPYLDSSGVKYADLEGGGTMEKMDEYQKMYNKGDTQLLLTHSNMFSCGMNLESTDHVVFVHDVCPALRQQVIGRAQRPGRNGHLLVTTLLYKAEQEERRVALPTLQ
jgi:superfamily II DNA or RNA helicase